MQELLRVQTPFRSPLFMKSGTGAGIRCASYPRGSIEPQTDVGEVFFNQSVRPIARSSLPTPLLPPHMLPVSAKSSENRSNLVAHFRVCRASLDPDLIIRY